MDKCVHRSQMPPIPVKETGGDNCGTEKVVKSKNELGLPFMVTDLV